MAINEEKINKRKLRASAITTIMSISLVLFMLGLLGLLLLNSQKLSAYVKENIGFSIIIKGDTNESEILQIKQELDNSKYVKSTKYITKEEASKELTNELGEDFVDFLGFNPLLPSIDIRFNADYANNDSISKLENQILRKNIVKEVFYHKSLVELVNKNVKKISVVLMAFTIILLLISIALINNTIKLSIYSKRFIIKSMQLVGATHSFIQKPFIVKAAINGIISSLIAIALLCLIVHLALKSFPELINIQDIDMFLLLCLVILAFGLLITCISTIFAVRKHLKQSSENIYY